MIPGKSRIATIRPNADGQCYFVEDLHRLERATDANAVRASRSNAQLASASEAEREGEVQSVHAYRLSEVLSGGNYVLRFPAASRIRAVGQDMNFDLVNSYYFSSSSGGRSYTGSGRMSGKSAAYGDSATNTSTTVPGSNDSSFTPSANATVDGTGSLTAPSTGAALRNAGNRLAGQVSASGRKGRMPKTGQPASAAAAVFCAAGLGVLLLFRRKEEI